MTQAALAFFGLTALWLAMGTSARGRRWAPVLGLMGQPWWLLHAWSTSAWGLLVLSLAYTAVYARGAWVQWRPR
jgi:multisubunit Na+/H+ antiporter MnhB subunit